jgi:predicted component of type VI protein secretion system
LPLKPLREQKGLFMQAMRLAAHTLADLRANHKAAQTGMDEALAILSPAQEVTHEAQ